MTVDEIKPTVRAFLLEEFLEGVDESELTDDMPLMSSGVLNSISTTRLVAFLEEKFAVQLAPHELSADYLDTVDMICALVVEKRAEG